MNVQLAAVAVFGIARDIVTKIVSTTEFIIVNLVAVTGSPVSRQMSGESGANGLNVRPHVNLDENSEAEFVKVDLV